MHTVLVIEDEAAIADTVLYALETEGFKTAWSRLGQEGVERVRQDPGISLVVLDVGLPDGSGFEFCKAIRQFSEVPIVFLTARNEEVDRIVGLEIGADDYVSKPFSPRELVARVKVILKRARAGSGLPARTGFTIEREKARIAFQGQLLDLTKYEYLILGMLLEQPERVFSRSQIMDRVWDEPEASLDRAVDTHVKSLRAKLRAVCPDTDPIKTHRGLGYSISGPVCES